MAKVSSQERAKVAGEQADAMIAALNTTPEAVAIPSEEGQQSEIPAITPAPVPPVATADSTDVEIPASNEIDQRLSEMQKQVEVANQRWNVLQGMINKKDSENEQLRVLLSQLSQSQAAAPAKAAAEVPGPMSAKDVEEYGADMIEMINRTVKQAINNATNPLTVKLAELESAMRGVGETTARTASDVFEDSLVRTVPTWKSVNVDPNFLAWLNEYDELTGTTRLVLLQDAYQKMDVQRTAKFFQKFIGETPVAQVASVTPIKPVPKADKHVAPGKGGSGFASTAESQPAARTWARADISKLYENFRDRKLTQAEFDVLEKDLFLAQREGRIAA